MCRCIKNIGDKLRTMLRTPWVIVLFQSSIVTAVLFASFSFLIYLVSDPPYFWESAREHSFKWFFIIGMVGSVFSQTCVEAFLDNNELISSFRLPGAKFVTKVSSPILVALAVGSIWTINDFEKHVVLTIFYLLLVVLLDFWVAWFAHKANSERASLSRDVCLFMGVKVDLVSFIGVAALAGWALSFGSSFVDTTTVDHMNQLAQNGVLGVDEAAQAEFQSVWEEVLLLLKKWPDVFLSGAVGFHFVVTMWLILTSLPGWSQRLTAIQSSEKTIDTSSELQKQ